MHITKKWLETKGACSDQVAIFAVEWPDGVDVNLEALLRAAELGLDLSWLAGHVIEGALWVKYLRQTAPLWMGYECQMASTRGEFNRQVAPILWELLQSQEAQGQ